MRDVKILCLNVRSGGGQRWEAILDFVDAHATDIVALTKWRTGVEGGSAESWGRREG